jgi:hypothetical protein
MRTWLTCLVLLAGCGSGDGNGDGGMPDMALNDKWEIVDVPNVDYFAVSGSSSTDVIIVGAHGTILRWNGLLDMSTGNPLSPFKHTLIQEQSPTTADLHGVFAVDPMTAFAVGDNGTILYWDGMMWHDQTLQPMPDAGAIPFLTGVWATTAMNAMVVGEQGAAYQWDGVTWKPVTTASPDNLLAINVINGNLTAVGTLGTIATWTGTTFTRQAIAGYSKTLGGISPNGFLVGVDGGLFTFDGNMTTMPITGLPTVFLRGVAQAGGDLWAVGFDATVARVRGGGSDIFVYPNIPERWIEGVWAGAPDDVWIVGASGTVIHGPPPDDPPLDGGVM